MYGNKARSKFDLLTKCKVWSQHCGKYSYNTFLNENWIKAHSIYIRKNYNNIQHYYIGWLYGMCERIELIEPLYVTIRQILLTKEIKIENKDKQYLDQEQCT